MLLYACDWCKVVKQPDEKWILGLAAETVGLTAARREVNILTAWNEQQARHSLAVHFCSVEHKDNYVAGLFERVTLPAETVIETTKTTVKPKRKSVRSVSSGRVTTTRGTKKKTKKRRRVA